MSGTAGDAFNLGTNLSGGVTLFDYVRVVTPGSIETEDPDGDVCIDSPVIDISGQGTVTITIKVEPAGG